MNTPAAPGPDGSRLEGREPLAKSEVVIAVAEFLRAGGLHVDVAWDRPYDIDIEATGARHLVAQAAAEEASAAGQAEAFFLALGELVGHAAFEDATYGLALPDNSECRSLVERLPAVARRFLRLSVFFVGLTDGVPTVEEVSLS